MEINNLFGLPAHPLLVHAPIVLVPLCLVAAIFMAAKPEWRRRFGVPTAVLAVVAATYEIVQTGHSGAKAAWDNTPPARG